MPSNTTNFGFEYPLSTDPLADGAQSIQDFATNADTTFADLLGGTTNQVLAKNSNTDMDFKWVTPSAKVYAIPKVSGVYYECFKSSANSSQTLTEDVTHYAPFYIADPTETFDRITILTGAGHTGTSTIRLGIYDMGQGVPTTVVLDAGTVSATASDTQYTITINQTLSQGWYWLAANRQSQTGVGETVNANADVSASYMISGVRPFAFGSGLAARPYYTETGITGAFATAGTLAVATRVMLVGLRYA